MVLLRVKPEKEWVRPGEPVRVRVAWHLDGPEDWLRVGLVWYTEGRGTRDVGVGDSRELDGRAVDGEEEVTLTAPEGPYSFHGRLITLHWVAELATAGGAAEQAPLVVAPTPVPVELYTGS
jgi:hypothetical protein